MYPVIGEPPLEIGALHATVISVSVDASSTGDEVLASGTVAQTKYQVFDTIEVPIAFVA